MAGTGQDEQFSITLSPQAAKYIEADLELTANLKQTSQRGFAQNIST